MHLTSTRLIGHRLLLVMRPPATSIPVVRHLPKHMFQMTDLTPLYQNQEQLGPETNRLSEKDVALTKSSRIRQRAHLVKVSIKTGLRCKGLATGLETAISGSAGDNQSRVLLYKAETIYRYERMPKIKTRPDNH